MKDKLEQYEKLYRADGSLNTTHFQMSTSFNESQLKQEILNTTKFLYEAHISERIFCILNNITTIQKCLCGAKLKFKSFKLGYKSYCSPKCSANSLDVKQRSKQTKLERYGNENYNNLDKHKLTCSERYGNDHFTNTQQMIKTNLERYGVKYVSQHKSAKDKAITTKIERYGVPQFKQILLSKETRRILFNKENFISFVKGKSRAIISYELGIDGTTVSKYIELYKCRELLVSCKSKFEQLLNAWFSKHHIRVISNTKLIISPLELDFYLPDYKIAIEINGNYWHSEKSTANKTGKNKDYHYNKWKLCREQGIDLYSYFEDELIDNFTVIKEKLKYLVNQNTCIVGARKCIITDIGYQQEREFLNTHHIQGESKARNKTIGAFHNNKLVAVFSWQKKKHYLEITRFACDTKASYPGLFSKMMKHMIKELKYHGEIVSFSNNGHSNGNVYRVSGFAIDKILGPSYWYTKDYYIRENRQKYMKTKIKKMFDIAQEEIDSKTEWQLMQEQGYDRIWDSGKIKWSKTI